MLVAKANDRVHRKLWHERAKPPPILRFEVIGSYSRTFSTASGNLPRQLSVSRSIAKGSLLGTFMMPTPERPRSIHSANGGIVLDIDGGRMFSLNVSGSLIFQFLDQGLEDDEIVLQLVERFAVTADVARADLAEFHRSLEKLSLLTRGRHFSKE